MTATPVPPNLHAVPGHTLDSVVQRSLDLLPHLEGLARAERLLALSADLAARGEVIEAVRAAAGAGEIFKAANVPAGRCDALLRIGIALRSHGDHAAALTTFEEAEEIARTLADPARLSQALRNLGICCSLLGRHQQALSCLGEALATAQTQPDVDTILNVQLSLYNALNRQAEPLPAGSAERLAVMTPLLERWQTLADDFAAIGNARLEAMARGNLAITLQRTGRVHEAAAALQALLGRYRELGMKPNEAICEDELGRCHEALGDVVLARDHYRRAFELLRDGGSMDDLQHALDGLSRTEEKLGDLAAALAALREWREVGQRKSDEAARNVVAQRELRIELARLSNQWAQQATQDPLTGLGNRRALDHWLAQALPRVEQGETLTLLLMDLDHFKQVNDGFGHDVGDTVLRRVAELIRQHCRSRDLAVRYGGEEFLLALSGVQPDEAMEIAERLRQAVAEHDWQSLRPQLAVTVSMGLTWASEAADAAGLLTLADQRLYAAKYNGRNRLVAA